MWPDRISNPGPLTYESGALPNALRGPAASSETTLFVPRWNSQYDKAWLKLLKFYRRKFCSLIFLALF